MRKLLAAAFFSLVACSPEDLAALQERAGEPTVNELSHRVSVRFEDGAARLTVSRQLRNDSTEFQSLNRRLALPEGAIATSLRVSTDGRWPVPGTLTTTEDAAAHWDLLIAPGTAAPSTLGMLAWSWEGGLDLDLFGLAPGATVNVEYELELSPDYQAGKLAFEYPQDEFLAPEFKLESSTLDHVLEDPAEAQSTLTSYRVTQPKTVRDSFEARWATYPLAVDRSLWRLEVDAAAELGAVPTRPNVVFAIDASHSEGPEGIAAQLELIAPYLANVPDAQVELVIYRRHPERLFGHFVPASDVARLLASTPADRLAPGNGSNLELGAALCAQALSQTAGIGRIVIFTDEAMRFGYSNDRTMEALATAPRDTIVHLVARDAPGGGRLSEQRDDTSELAPVAAAFGGIFLRVSGHARDEVLSADTMLGLVRPIRVDDFFVEATGVPEEQINRESILSEGATMREMELSEQPPEEITITGKIWAREVRRVVSLDRSLSNRLPGLSVGDDAIRGQLSDEELKTVAFVSHAVSPVTSFFCAAPDAAPSTAGYSGESTGSLSLRGLGCGGFGSRSTCGFGRWTDSTDYDSILRGLLAPGLAACEQRYGDASLASMRLEATGDEVVDVQIAFASSELTACLTEAGWALRLSPEFSSHRIYSLGQLR